MFGWLQDLIDGISSAISEAFSGIGQQISQTIWSTMMTWMYDTVYSAVADFFSMMGNMGADILINGKTAIVTGQEKLYGTRVFAHDLRAGAALVIAGLAAEGTTTVENMNYSAKRLLQVFPKHFTPAQAERYARKPSQIANRVYANRLGNGNEASGDGWRYRGRGYIQITGRSNYKAYQDSGLCVGNLMAHPEWLCNSPGRMKSAMWFFMKSGCNELADNDDIEAITRRINGALNGYADRCYYYRRLKRIFMI